MAKPASPRKKGAYGPPVPFPVPPGVHGDGCAIIFGHNLELGKVLMQFSVAASQLLFSPEEAEDVARQLQYRAQAARGEKTS